MLVLLPLALMALASPSDWNATAERVSAQVKFEECATKWAEHFVLQKEPAELIAGGAIRFCWREQERFSEATGASMSDKNEAEAWVSDRTGDLKNRIVDFVLLFRSDIPTGSLPGTPNYP